VVSKTCSDLNPEKENFTTLTKIKIPINYSLIKKEDTT
jgi:hypothetical protein